MRLVLGAVYTEHQHQCRGNSAIMLAILLSLKTMESCKLGLQHQSGEDSIVFNDNSIECHRRVVTALMQTLGVNGPLKGSDRAIQ